MLNKIKLLIIAAGVILVPLPVFSQCYELLWSDEFDYTGFPDAESWSFEEGGGGWGNNELQYYKAEDEDNAWVENGTLTIRAIQETFGGRNYTSARINTRGKFNVQYGKIEARMKLPYGQGIWPAFWMLGESITQVGWPSSGEIDIMEMVGGEDRNNTIHGTVHWDNEGSHAQYGKAYTLSSGIFADDYHTFSVEWTPTEIRWYVDGVQYNVINIEPAGLSEFHDDFFIILNLAVGGNWPGSPDPSTEFPQTLEVDYVRVYKNSSEITENISIKGDSVISPRAAAESYSLPSSPDWQYEWTVPAGATIIAGQGTSTIHVEWGCDAGSIGCTVTGSCDNYVFTKDIRVEAGIKGPLFVDENEQNILFYTDSLANTTFLWNVPDDAEIVSGQGSDSIRVNWGNTYEDVLLTTENSCGTNEYQYTVVKPGQYPYPDINSPHKIPGVIEAVEYDFGGEGVSYHDNSAGNEGPGPRQENDVDTENGDGGSPNVGWIRPGEWLEYTVEVDSASYYEISLRVASNNASGGPLSFIFDGEEMLSDVEIPGTGGWTSFVTYKAGVVYLTEEDSLMRVYFQGGDFNLGKITFTPTEKPSSAGSEKSPNSLTVYPVPADDLLHVNSTRLISGFEIHDITGKKIEGAGSLNANSLQLNIGSYPSGIYFLRTLTIDGSTQVNKLLIK